MPTQPSLQLHQKLQPILSKYLNQRTPQQSHHLYLFFKTPLKDFLKPSESFMLSSYIQHLQLLNKTTHQQLDIVWLYVLKGQFYYHGMVYRVGQFLEITQQDTTHLVLKNKSQYVVLTAQNRQKARNQAQRKRFKQQKLLVKGVLFQNIPIAHKQFNYFWSFFKSYPLNKTQQFPIHQLQDMIFIVVEGSLILNYQWKRTIKLRQLRIGSIFSTFLGRYFCKTGKQLQNINRLQFTYYSKQSTLILGFNADILYQQPQLTPYKYLLTYIWNIYLQRTTQLTRIISQLGTLKPNKKQIIKNIQQQIQSKLLKQKIVQIPSIIQCRKLKGLTSRLSREKSNRRKLPNLVSTEPLKQLTLSMQKNNPENGEIKDLPEETVRNSRNSKADKSEQTYKRLDASKSTLNTKQQKYRFINSVQYSQRCLPQDKRPLTSRFKTLQSNPTNPQKSQNRKLKTQLDNQTYFDSKPLISQKLKNQSQSIPPKYKTLVIDTIQPTHKYKKYQLSRQQLQQFISSRRANKYGPKKRLHHYKRV